MFEVWMCKEEPAVRLVVAKGGALPAELGPRDWTLVGPFEAAPDVAREVERRGYHFYQAEEPPTDPRGLESDGAAGA